jgi:hypothetical protein
MKLRWGASSQTESPLKGTGTRAETRVVYFNERLGVKREIDLIAQIGLSMPQFSRYESS